MSGVSAQAGDWNQGSVTNSSVPSALLPARDRFRDLTVNRIIAFESFRIDFQSGGDPLAALEGVIALAHKIAGVAETLGYPKVGKLAAAIDQQSRNGLDRGLPAAEIWRSMDPQLVALMDEMELLLDQ